ADELAFVIGHEMAHVIRRHAIDRILSQKALSMASLATPTGRAIAPWLRSVGMQWLEKAYSREQEYEADILGSRLAQVAGFDPHGALRMLERFRSLEGSSDPIGLGAYLSTHPPINDRQQHIREQLRLDR
ncbi:MAG: M48 family metalloprotease, partial [Vicinamibacterales bacterium]